MNGIQWFPTNEALDKIYISTFGRGIWENSLSSFVGIIENKPSEIGIELYPSLNNGSFTINMTDTNVINETLSLEIIDIRGQLVYKELLSGKSTFAEHLNLLSGMYFAKIKGKNIYGVKRFVVQ